MPLLRLLALCESPVKRCLNPAGHYRCQVCGRSLCAECSTGADNDLCLLCYPAVAAARNAGA